MKLGTKVKFNVCLRREKAQTMDGSVFMWFEQQIPTTTGIVVGTRVLKDGNVLTRREGHEIFEARAFRKIYLVALNMKQILKVPVTGVIEI